MSDICFLIPVHAESAAFFRTVFALSESVRSLEINATLLVSNSGSAFSKEVEFHGEVNIFNIAKNNYWTGSVAFLYEKAQLLEAKRIILMNHDCIPSDSCLQKLLKFSDEHPMSIGHAVIAYKDRPNIIWWAGSNLKRLGNFSWPYKGEEIADLPELPYSTDSMMGQCLILPIEAAQKKFLHEEWLPHYFADSVQTSCMRRAGFSLYIVPSAIAYTDDSDTEGKRARTRCHSWKGVLNAWFAPYSNRNLKATFISNILHHDSIFSGFFSAILMTLGRVIKVIFEVSGIIRKL